MNASRAGERCMRTTAAASPKVGHDETAWGMDAGEVGGRCGAVDRRWNRKLVFLGKLRSASFGEPGSGACSERRGLPVAGSYAGSRLGGHGTGRSRRACGLREADTPACG